MHATDTSTSGGTPELVLGIYLTNTTAGLALRNPASKPQLTYGALLAPADGEDLADYADRITALVATIRQHREQPVTVHLAGLRGGRIVGYAGNPVHDPDRYVLTGSIALALAEPFVVVPYGDYADALSGYVPSPLRDGWPDGWYPHQHQHITPVLHAATLTRWAPFLPPAPPTQLDRCVKLGGRAPLSAGPEARGERHEGDAGAPRLAAVAATGHPESDIAAGHR